jgi:hypothetical protein
MIQLPNDISELIMSPTEQKGPFVEGRQALTSRIIKIDEHTLTAYERKIDGIIHHVFLSMKDKASVQDEVKAALIAEYVKESQYPGNVTWL